MSKNFHWNTEEFGDEPLKVALFVSRNKDNKDIDNFKERKKSFVFTNLDKVLKDFETWSNCGQEGEVSRLYISVNARDEKKVYKDFLHFLIDNPDFNLAALAPKLAGIAAKKENAAEHKWLFDFDSDDENLLKEFTNFISNSAIPYFVTKTVNGYAIVTYKGFDTRELLAKYPFVTLKRDDMLLFKVIEKRGI